MVFTKEISEDLRVIFSDVCQDFEAMLEHDPRIERALWGGSLWSPSYFAGSAGGDPLSIIRQYIEQQEPPD